MSVQKGANMEPSTMAQRVSTNIKKVAKMIDEGTAMEVTTELSSSVI